MDYTNNLLWQKSHPGMKLAYNLDYDRHSIWEIPALGSGVSGLPFYVQEVGLTIAYEDYYVYRENLDSYLLTYTRLGSITVEYNGCTTDAPEGTLGWFDCKQPHAYYTTRGEPKVEVYFIHMYGDGAEKYVQHFKRLSKTGCVRIGDAGSVTYYFKKLISLYAPGARSEITDYSACSLLAMLCLTVFEQAMAQQEGVVPAYIEEIKQFLNAHIAEHVDLERLAQSFFLSKSYIQKQFKRFVGMSPAEYLAQLRISQAKLLLRTTDSPIAAIGIEVGMPDSSYFCYAFRRAEGVTPLEYRKLWGYSIAK